MADVDKKKDNDNSNKAQTVAHLSIPTIITALHQNAMKHSDASSKGAKIINSAIDDSTEEGTLESVGE